MNIPNILTVIRFCLVPVFIYTFYYQNQNHYILPLTIFVLAVITDILDGYIARKYNLITQVGKLLDPLADKTMQLSALFVFTDKGLIPLWIAIVIFVKEFFLIIGSLVLYKKKVVVQANWYGKLATVMLNLAIAAIIFMDGPHGTYLIVAAVALTLYAAVRYTTDHIAKDKEKKSSNTSLNA